MEETTRTVLESRTCSKCGLDKELGRFSKDPKARDGYRAQCKDCRNQRVRQQKQASPELAAAMKAYQDAYREAHREKARATTARYRTENPERVRAVLEQYRTDPANRQVARERARAFRIANPDRRSVYEKSRRARKMSLAVGVITPALLAQKLAYWGYKCWICGGKPDTWDHVKPLNKKGYHMLANLRPACRRDNTRKSDMWPYAKVLRVLGKVG